MPRIHNLKLPTVQNPTNMQVAVIVAYADDTSPQSSKVDALKFLADADSSAKASTSTDTLALAA